MHIEVEMIAIAIYIYVVATDWIENCTQTDELSMK